MWDAAEAQLKCLSIYTSRTGWKLLKRRSWTMPSTVTKALNTRWSISPDWLFPDTKIAKRESKMSRRNLTISTSPTKVNLLKMVDKSSLSVICSQFNKLNSTEFCVNLVEHREERMTRLSRRGGAIFCNSGGTYTCSGRWFGGSQGIACKYMSVVIWERRSAR